MAKAKYPNPQVWKYKDEINWKAQLENVKEIASICVDMAKEADWKAYGAHMKLFAKEEIDRMVDEWKTFKTYSTDEKIDIIVNGEKHLGRLYRADSMAFTRRQWRGIVDTAYDFYRWGKMWLMLLMTFSKDLIPALNSMLYYRWYVSYFCCHSFLDRSNMGLKGRNLRMSHAAFYDIFRYVAENLVILSKSDVKNGNSSALRKKMVLFDEMTMGQIFAGFPGLVGVPYQLLPIFLVSELDQLTCVPYIDAVEEYGLPADTCPLPTSECGALILDALPHTGAGFISSSMPCDGSVMASSYVARRFPDLPIFHLCFPVRYYDETTVVTGTEDIKACIKWIEDLTGEKWSWDAYFTQIKRFNEEQQYELKKWEMNKTDNPQFIGPAYELFRKWNYEMDGGADPRVWPTVLKIDKIMNEAYKAKDEAWVGKMRHRALIWSCPAHYYANFSGWIANCWGVNVLVEMESLNYTKELNTSDKEEALNDLTRLYERMVMRRHTNGGYQNVVDECFKQAEDWRAEIILMYQHVSCKNMATVQGILEDIARQRNQRMIWIEHDLMDPRTVSRGTMRSRVNQYMRTVMNEEPVDPSLEDISDDIAW